MEITFSSTTHLSAAIQARHVSAVEVLEAHLLQIEKHNPVLNAIITMNAEQARERAREADIALARGDVWGPLHGVPFTLKDAHATAGMRTTAGFLPLANYVPPTDGHIATCLKKAGGILIGKTNVSVLLGDIQSNNPIFGRTNNPWNIERTPGGSSGGAAAALASGMTPFEIGSDLAASIRLPAHFCGVFGFKPTENRVSAVGHIPDPPGVPRSLRMMAAIGPMARTVEDLILLYSIIAGPDLDGRDPEVRPMLLNNVPEVELKDLRIAFAPTFPGIPIAHEVREAVEELAKQLDPECKVIEEAVPPVDFSQELAARTELLGMIFRAFQSDSSEPPMLSHYLQALNIRDQFIIAWEHFFKTWDVLLCAPAMITAFPHCETESLLQVDGQEADYWMANAHGKLFNYTGHPAVILPYKLDHDGLPIGIQLVGKRWDESYLLAIAKAISKVTSEFRRPSGY